MIGEHTDYNDGFVFPMAIDLDIRIALRPRIDKRVKVYSLNYQTIAEFSLDSFEHTEDWSEYVRAIVWALREEGYSPSGWEGVLVGDIPSGGGLSSSAALEMALLRAFQSVSGWDWDGVAMAQIAQQGENSWVGVQSGIMDQMASALGEKGKALLIDIRDLRFESVPLVPGTRIMILDTGTRRGLVDSVYNQRVKECQTAAEIMGISTLREAASPELEEYRGDMEETIYKRAHHVVSENERTLKAVEAMRQNNPDRLGQLLNESHESLKRDYEVSSPELDLMVELARDQPGTFGARMTGAGFGGAAIALIPEEQVEPFTAAVEKEYIKAAGRSPVIFSTRASKGAEQVY